MLTTVFVVAYILISLLCTIAIVSATILSSRQDDHVEDSPIEPSPALSGVEPSNWIAWPDSGVLLLIPVLILVASIMLRVAAPSLPGSGLYPIKRAGEEVKGMLVRRWGNPVAWHIHQVDRRIHEMNELEASGRSPDPMLVQEVKEEAERALMAAAVLPSEEREKVLGEWSLKLETRQEIFGETSVIAKTLAEPYATVVSLRLTPPAEQVAQASELTITLGGTDPQADESGASPIAAPTPYQSAPAVAPPTLPNATRMGPTALAPPVAIQPTPSIQQDPLDLATSTSTLPPATPQATITRIPTRLAAATADCVTNLHAG
jgi:hypothetical protein